MVASFQLKHGTRFIGRWMMPLENGDVEIFAIWEYSSIKEDAHLSPAIAFKIIFN
ncbi:MAG: hypothetical protein RLZZ381_3595 [Cyanobacteriota bacterium]|jgi:hypothetical protein